MPEMPILSWHLDVFLGEQLHGRGDVVVSIVGLGAIHKTTPSLLISALMGPGVILGGIDFTALRTFFNWFFTIIIIIAWTKDVHTIFNENLHKRRSLCLISN